MLKKTLFITLLFTSLSAISGLKEARINYSKWEQTYKTVNDEHQKKQLNQLKNYALYPYAKYQYLTHNIKTIPLTEIQQFTQHYSDFPLNNQLLQNYVEQLTQNKNWQTIVKLNSQQTTALKCQYLYALAQTGQRKAAFSQVRDIWVSDRDLPSACDPLFNEWNRTQYKDLSATEKRLELVLKSNRLRVARYITRQLPESTQPLKKQLLALFDDIKTLPNFIKSAKANDFTKKMVLLSFRRYVNSDVTAAKNLIPTIVKRYSLNKNEEQSLYDLIASNYFKSSATPSEIKWRENYLKTSKNTDLIERRIRLALNKNDKVALKKWLTQLPSEAQDKDEWIYWKAQVLMSEGKKREANDLLKKLTQRRGFYPMVSAQQLGITYPVNLNYAVTNSKNKVAENSALSKKYDNNPIIKRINELRYFAKYTEAKREWLNFLSQQKSEQQLAELARYALNRGWGEYSVQATIAGKLWDNWYERLPLVFTPLYQSALKGKAISHSYSLAISRQESALDPSVQSYAGARGLMQLMPATAKETARKVNGLNYTSSQQLYDPKTNILLGTEFLNQVYTRFGHNRILASAAYNAGPSRVNRWLAESNGQIDAIAFIESIPFKETRNYVKSVLTYDYLYQLLLNQKPKGVLTQNELNRKY